MMRSPEARKRESREELFARAYVANGMNATEAATTAGYSAKGSRNAAHVAGQRLLRNATVKTLIAELTKDKFGELDLSAERILQELGRLGFSNMLDYLAPQEDGTLVLDFSKLTREQAAAIQEIREDKTGGTGDGERKQILRTTFKLADKTRALQLLGQYRKLFTEIVEHTASEDLAALIAEGRKRAAQRR